MSRLRVINLGLPKSGTTTLGKALSRAGLLVADWKIRPGQGSAPELQDQLVGRLLYEDYFATGDPLARSAEFDAFSEISAVGGGESFWPQFDYGLLMAIARHHPGTRFLLSHRAPGAIVESMMAWRNLGTARLPKHAVPGLPAGFGTEPAHLERWVAGHYAYLRAAFGGRADFLEYEITDPEAPAKIGAFLGRELPWWGHANERSEAAR
ncbi:sulfotransferase family protein [Roseivivax sp. GX 12232]|uniref:sulfotransferase family protein n=1 Tax=Roseivivax sp. GX 12232 TaxID=2900547 RepID=UPI001E512732|nr:sulfotransferase family protein [Roseivivax sp. GX 12232]MCE0504529.1 sulfotransferase family protein [Roseivivax sp. GX 12232]